MKPQIEKVSHNEINEIQTYFVICDYPSGRIEQHNYSSESIARIPCGYGVGIWKPKQQPSC